MKTYTLDEMKRAFECGRNFQLTGENNFQELIEALSPALPIHSVVRGAVTSHCLSLKDECEFTNTCPECTKPATEPLPAEGEAQGVCAGDKHGPIKRHKRRIYCGTCLKVLLRV
jgi:hypothetical protein